MLTALRKIYDFAGNWQGVLKKSVAFSLLHSIFDMFQIAALFLILIGLTEGMTLQIIVFTLLLLIIGILGKFIAVIFLIFRKRRLVIICVRKSGFMWVIA